MLNRIWLFRVDRHRWQERWMWKVLFAAAWFFILSGVISVTTTQTSAFHRDPRKEAHTENMHVSGPGKDETVCVDSTPWSQYSVAAIQDILRRKLYTDNPSADWHGLANNGVFFSIPALNDPKPCWQLSGRAEIPIEVYFDHDVTTLHSTQYWDLAQTPCDVNRDGKITSADNYACAAHRRHRISYGHKHSTKSYIFFPRQTLWFADGTPRSEEQRAWVVSHEFGHVLGLGDGGYQGDQNCGRSVMHTGKGVCGSPTYYWPTQDDRTAVTLIAENYSASGVGGNVYDDTSNYVVYEGAWGTCCWWPRAYNNTDKWSNAGDSQVALTFVGSRITWQHMMTNNRGAARVYIDDVEVGYINSYAPEARWQVANTWSLPYDEHTISVKPVGNGYVDVDAFIVDAASANPGSYDNPPAQVQYAGSWTHDSTYSGPAWGGTTSYSNISEDVASFTFTGSQVTYVYTKAHNRGIAAITIDGVDRGYIDMYSAGTAWQQSTSYGNLGWGVHTLTISVTGSKNSAATDRFVDVDRVISQ